MVTTSTKQIRTRVNEQNNVYAKRCAWIAGTQPGDRAPHSTHTNNTNANGAHLSEPRAQAATRCSHERKRKAPRYIAMSPSASVSGAGAATVGVEVARIGAGDGAVGLVSRVSTTDVGDAMAGATIS